MKKATLSDAAALDGRFRRGERSRQAIVAALFELVGRGVLRPTAQQVADQAGVGIRSVFRHFSEMDSLYAAMDARLEGDAIQILRGGARGGELEERIAGLMRLVTAPTVQPELALASASAWARVSATAT